MRISDWSSDVCSSDLAHRHGRQAVIAIVEELVEPRIRADALMKIAFRTDRKIFLEFAGEQHLAAAPALMPEIVGSLPSGKKRQALPDARKPAHAASFFLAVRTALARLPTAASTSRPRLDRKSTRLNSSH